MSCNFLFPEEFVPIFAKTELKKSLDLFDDPTKRASVYLFLALENFAGATTKSSKLQSAKPLTYQTIIT